MAAILENDPSALQEALQSGVRLDVTDSHGHTPLDMALAHGNAFSAPGMVELLLRHGARPGPGLADPALTLARLLATQAPLSQLAGKPVILEVEHPEDEQSRRRIAFYQRNGLVLNDQHDYFVPPVRNLKHRLYFHLMSYPTEIDALQFERYYPQILQLVYGVNE